MEPIEIEGIHLTKEDGKTVVEVQIEGLWYPVIEEGHENFDHWITSKGIVEEVHRINLDLVKDEKPIVVEGDIDYGASCEHVHPGQPCGEWIRSQVYRKLT